MDSMPSGCSLDAPDDFRCVPAWFGQAMQAGPPNSRIPALFQIATLRARDARIPGLGHHRVHWPFTPAEGCGGRI